MTYSFTLPKEHGKPPRSDERIQTIYKSRDKTSLLSIQGVDNVEISCISNSSIFRVQLRKEGLGISHKINYGRIIYWGLMARGWSESLDYSLFNVLINCGGVLTKSIKFGKQPPIMLPIDRSTVTHIRNRTLDLITDLLSHPIFSTNSSKRLEEIEKALVFPHLLEFDLINKEILEEYPLLQTPIGRRAQVDFLHEHIMRTLYNEFVTRTPKHYYFNGPMAAFALRFHYYLKNPEYKGFNDMYYQYFVDVLREMQIGNYFTISIDHNCYFHTPVSEEHNLSWYLLLGANYQTEGENYILATTLLHTKVEQNFTRDTFETACVNLSEKLGQLDIIFPANNDVFEELLERIQNLDVVFYKSELKNSNLQKYDVPIPGKITKKLEKENPLVEGYFTQRADVFYMAGYEDGFLEIGNSIGWKTSRRIIHSWWEFLASHKTISYSKFLITTEMKIYLQSVVKKTASLYFGMGMVQVEYALINMKNDIVDLEKLDFFISLLPLQICDLPAYPSFNFGVIDILISAIASVNGAKHLARILVREEETIFDMIAGKLLNLKYFDLLAVTFTHLDEKIAAAFAKYEGQLGPEIRMNFSIFARSIFHKYRDQLVGYEVLFEEQFYEDFKSHGEKITYNILGIFENSKNDLKNNLALNYFILTILAEFISALISMPKIEDKKDKNWLTYLVEVYGKDFPHNDNTLKNMEKTYVTIEQFKLWDKNPSVLEKLRKVV